MLHPKKPTSVINLRNACVDEFEWLRVTISLKAKWLRSQNVFFLEISANEGLCIVSRLHLNVTSQETSICRLFEKHSCWWDWMVTRNQYAQSEMITVKSLFFWKFLRMKDVVCIQVSHPKSANIFRLFRNKWNIYSTQKNFYVMISNFENCVVVTKNVIITKLNSFRHTFTSTRDVTRTWNDYSTKSSWRGQYEFLTYSWSLRNCNHFF